jgi:hypothetical protein
MVTEWEESMETFVRSCCLTGALVLLASACGPGPVEPEPACEGWLPGDIALTELLPDPEGVDTGQEWLEVFNPGRVSVNLRGLTLYVARADGTQERATVLGEPVLVEPGGYAVLGDVRSGPLPAHVDASYGDALGAMGNAGGVLGLRCGEQLLDEVRYAGPVRAGVARLYDGRLPPDPTANDDVSRWCDAPPGGARASPGAANPACPQAPSPDGGGSGPSGETCLPLGASTPRSVMRPRSGDLIITELMADPRGGDAAGEWVELLATAQVDLNGVVVGTEVSGSPLVSSRCLTLQPGQHALVAREANPLLNGGLPPPLATFGVELRNTGGTVVVRSGELILDALVYGPAAEGVALQVSADALDVSLNDAPSSRCAATEGYGAAGNLGTPGRVNRVCASGDSTGGGTGGSAPATCVDPVTQQARPIRAADPGALVVTEFMADPSAVADTLGEWVELYALRDVDLNGVALSNEAGGKSTLESSRCLVLRAGSFGVLARSAGSAANGGLPAVLGTFSFSLGNSRGARALKASREGSVLDEVTWTSAALSGVSMQVDPSRKEPARNDGPGSFCPTPEGARYGAGDRGTPGAENIPCAP